jgi:hypothetical protein
MPDAALRPIWHLVRMVLADVRLNELTAAIWRIFGTKEKPLEP